MNGFHRSIKIAMRQRLMLAGVLVSSLLVAVFWGANLGTVYPIVDVVLKGRSLHEWVDDNIASLESECAHGESLLKTQDAVIAEERQRETLSELQRERALIRNRLQADRKALAQAQRLRPWIQGYMPSQPFPTLVVVVVVLFIGTVLKSIFLVINTLMVERIALQVGFQARKKLFRHTLEMDLAGITENHTSGLLAHFTHDMECMTSGIRTVFGRALREPLKILACLVGAAWISWRLLAFSLIVTPLAFLLINRVAKSIKRASRRALEEMSLLYKRLSESIGGIELVKACTMERYERRQFHLVSKKYMDRSMRIALYQVLIKPINEMGGIAVIASAILVGGYLVLYQETHLWGVLKMSNRPLNFGLLMTFFALLAGISDPFRKLADVYSEIQRAAAAADRICGVIDQKPVIVDPPQARPVEPLALLRFDNVAFAYRGGADVIRGINLEINAGQTIAIVGANGSGKSTLTRLIPRFHDPTSGCVRWNGVDIREFRRRDLRTRIGIVAQRTLLFNDTVFNNIRYGSHGASRAEVIRAAIQAHAHEFIETDLPHGYETTVGQDGNTLSGGQRQRIAMARALLCQPELLILDEATSQMDLESERLIRQSLEQFTRDRTAIVITHRLETLAICDRIVVMQNGSILAAGTHDELLVDSPFYRRIHQMHFAEA